MYEEVSFPVADGTTLRGRLYPATTSEPSAPIIVMAGGFSATMDLGYFPYAEAFQAAGLAVLIYDHRGFGVSEGAIRQEIDPFQQVNDWRDAITFAVTRPGVDPERVGIWGSSYSGGHVLVLGATDARVKCIIGQVPFVSGSQTTARQSAEMRLQSNAMLAADRVARQAGEPPMMIPIVTEDPMQPAVLGTRDAWDYTMRIIDDAPTWRNEVTLRSLELSGAYEPGEYVARLAPKPLMLVLGSRDLIITPDLTLDLYARAHEPKRLVLLDCGHFDSYESHFAESSEAAVSWFREHLL